MIRVISQAEARRIAKSWGSRLPSRGRVLYRGETITDAKINGGFERLYQDSLKQWILERKPTPSEPAR